MSLNQQILTLNHSHWQPSATDAAVIEALEIGKVLHFPKLGFALHEHETPLLSPQWLAPKSRNISVNATKQLKGAVGDAAHLGLLQGMIARFRAQSQAFVEGLLPAYAPHLRYAPTSYRPAQVENRVQSWRADDKRLHVDAFPSRPNRGERILRVFANVNPLGQPRVWRVGQSFEANARQFLPTLKPYSAWQARALNALGVTKSLRSEYDHQMLQLHDAMKGDAAYQADSQQATVCFAPASVWICFSDQTAHAAMSGQFMLEQTLHIDPQHQYHPQLSPLAILTRLAGRALI